MRRTALHSPDCKNVHHMIDLVNSDHILDCEPETMHGHTLNCVGFHYRVTDSPAAS